MTKLSQKYIIPSYQTDCSYRLRPTSFMSIAQEAADVNAKELGFGHDTLVNHNIAWILSKVHVEFVDTPLWKEEIILNTWHKGRKGIFYLRDFLLTDMDGNERVKATTSWLLLNLESRSVVRHAPFDDEYGICSENAFEAPAAAVRMPKEQTPELVKEHIVSYSDIDKNQHANNAMYMRWSMNSIDYEITSKRPVKEFTINFNSETKIGEKVDIYRIMEEREDGLHVFLEGKVGEKSAYIVEIVF